MSSFNRTLEEGRVLQDTIRELKFEPKFVAMFEMQAKHFTPCELYILKRGVVEPGVAQITFDEFAIYELDSS